MTPPPRTIRCGETTAVSASRPSARYRASSAHGASSSSSSGGLPQRASSALPAVAVERAHARERIVVAIVRDADVAHLRVLQTVHRRAADEDAGPDACADGQVAADV